MQPHMPSPSHMPPPALSRRADATLAEQLAERFAQRIEQRLLAPGARLPSIRECARAQSLSPSTVVAAYDRLLARGLVQARPQRGYFVRERALPAKARGPAAQPTARLLPVSATALIRGMLQRDAHLGGPGLGTLPAEWLDLPMLQQALRKVLADPQQAAAALHYGHPAGEPRLREQLRHSLAELGIRAGTEQIVTTQGATQALDFVARTLLRPGDPVLVDEPGWAVEHARLAAAGMQLLPVPRGEDGPDLAVMARLMKAHQPRLYVTVSVLHNPTGASLSLQAAHQVLQLAHEHDVHIVEDDTYAHLASPHLPRLAALDGLRRTLYVSGFSKFLAPGWRVGYLAAPAALVERLVDTKLLSSLTTPSWPELALAHCLEQGHLLRHAERLRQRLAAARARVVKLAQAHGFTFATPPRGLFGWIEVGTDTERAARALLDDGWLLAPGTLFHVPPRPSTLMRINFATSHDLAFWRRLQTLARRGPV